MASNERLAALEREVLSVPHFNITSWVHTTFLTGRLRRQYDIHQRAVGRYWLHLDILAYVGGWLAIPAFIAALFAWSYFCGAYMSGGGSEPLPVAGDDAVRVMPIWVSYLLLGLAGTALLLSCHFTGTGAATWVRMYAAYGRVLLVEKDQYGTINNIKGTRLLRLGFANRVNEGWTFGRDKKLMLVLETRESLDTLPPEYLYGNGHYTAMYTIRNEAGKQHGYSNWLGWG